MCCAPIRSLSENSSHIEDDYPLDPRVLDALWHMEDHHFWHVARNGWIARVLAECALAAPARVLEVGCGSGAVLRSLTAAGFEVTGVDTARVQLERARRRCPGAELVEGDVAELGQLSPRPFQVIGLFDVLEHVDDPGRLLRTALEYAAADAWVMVTVPGDRALASVVDDLVGHKKRYQVGELCGLFEEIGLCEVREYGIFRMVRGLVGWRRKRDGRRAPEDLDEAARVDLLVDDMVVPAAPVNLALGWLCGLERRLGFGAALARQGASQLAIGRVGS